MADDKNKRPLIIRLTIDVKPKELRRLYSVLENECLPFEAFVGVPKKNTGGEREFSVEVQAVHAHYFENLINKCMRA